VDEKRKFKRLRYEVEIELSYYRKKSGTEIIKKMRTENISAGGIRATTSNRLEVGSLMSIKLTMPHTGDEISCFAQVAWIRPLKDGTFDTGFAFSNLSNKEIAVIDRFVEKELDKGIE
jgi:Tfp pilus assembly protein PilZ